MAIEIVDFPMKHGESFQFVFCMFTRQRVNDTVDGPAKACSSWSMYDDWKKGFNHPFWWLAGLRWPIHSTMMLDQINHWECVQDGAPPVMWMLVYKPHELARYIYHKP